MALLRYAKSHIPSSQNRGDAAVSSATIKFRWTKNGAAPLGEFYDHEGFDGVMLGLAEAGYHLEFTHERGATAGRAPGHENLLVFYLPKAEAYNAAVARMQGTGHAPVHSHNPYWDLHGKTFEDADGYRVVLFHGSWENAPTVVEVK